MISILNMCEPHRSEVINMMHDFYSSPAVHTNGSEEIFQRDFNNCINDNPYLEGYVFTDDNAFAGYSMIAKSFLTEFAKSCIWLEDIYIKPEHRGKGIAGQFLAFIGQKYPDSILRLEVEDENEHAVHVYKKNGFEFWPYLEMKKFL